MKITRLETFHVRPRWLFLKIHTDSDIFGWGEPSLEGRSQTVETCLREMERELIGQDPRRIEHLWQQLYRGAFYRNGPVFCSAISGIEMALWDILGKSLGAPVHQLLGGRVRDRIRLYGWIKGERTGDYIEDVTHEIGLGKFTAYKMLPVPAMRAVEPPSVVAKIIEGVAAVRAAAGPNIDIALDFHGRVAPAMARRLARKLEQFEPMFLEEPVLPGDVRALKEVAQSTTIPIAAGERLFTRWAFADLIEAQAVAIVQPDLSHVGGIFEARKIAAMAETRDIAVAPHCPLGPISLAACLQLDACTPNFLCQEHLGLGETYLKTPFEVVDGYVAVAEAPGLGIEVDEDKVRAGEFAGDWTTPQFRHADGSFAEW